MNRNMNFELDPLSKLRMERDQQLKEINNEQNNNNLVRMVEHNIENFNEQGNMNFMQNERQMERSQNNRQMERSQNNFVNENFNNVDNFNKAEQYDNNLRHENFLNENYQKSEVVEENYENYENKIDMANKIEQEGLVKSIWDDIKEYMIIILLFTLLSFDNVVLFFRNSIPFINTLESTVPAKLLRGLLLVILLFIIKRKI